MIDKKMHEKATALLEAAQAYWAACYEANEPGAVRWLTDEDGRLLIFTRGEYTEQLMKNIFSRRDILTFDGEFISTTAALDGADEQEEG